MAFNGFTHLRYLFKGFDYSARRGAISKEPHLLLFNSVFHELGRRIKSQERVPWEARHCALSTTASIRQSVGELTTKTIMMNLLYTRPNI